MKRTPKRSILAFLALNFPLLCLPLLCWPALCSAGLFLSSEWPLPGPQIQSSPPAAENDVNFDPVFIPQSFEEEDPLTDLDDLDGLQTDVKKISLSLNGKDPMVAAGRNFVVVSTSQEVSFRDKEGAPLATKNGVFSTIATQTMFAEFLDRESANDINKHTGFILPCDSPVYPNTTLNKFCVGRVLDTRVYFDALGNRFIILAEAKNVIRTDLWRPEEYPDKFSGSKNGFEWCGVYENARTGKDSALPSTSYCALARRHQFFAISKTEDPRDGFYTYAIKKQNYVDFPWGSVNAEGDMFTIGAANPGTKYGAVATVIRLSDLRNGNPEPRYFQLSRADLIAAHPNTVDTSTSPYKNNLYNPAPIVQHGSGAGLQGHTLLLSPLNRWKPGYNPDVIPGMTDKLRVFGFGSPQGQGIKPVVHYAESVMPDPFLPSFPMHTVYRNGNLHMAWQVTETVRPKRKQLRYIRVPISVTSTPGNVIKFQSVFSTGYSYWVTSFLDKTNLFPALAVNANEELIVPYRRGGGAEIRLIRWHPDWSSPATNGTLMHLADVTWKERDIDYSWAVVDPADDQTFWFAQRAQITDNYSQFHLYRVGALLQ
ncbi:MAG: hypothetical protein CMK89_12105 [Pseudomonadales bacterium]|nr:hypothetical protein [Pseudomonadales bacterium]